MHDGIRSRSSSWRQVVIGIIIAAAGIGSLSAQTTASILGTIKDQSGAVLPGAKVTATNTETGLSREATAGSRGEYILPSLSAGAYDIQATMAGFQTGVRKGVTLTIGRDATMDFALEVGAVSVQVTITGEAPLIETTTATVSGLVDPKQMHDIPLNARSFIELVPLQGGASITEAGSSSTSKGFGKKLSISGTRYNANLFLLDGTDINDAEGGAGSAAETLAGVETVREFQVVTNAYDASYGRHSGGVISAITKSGTNQFHGSLFEFLRNAKLDAAKWEDNKNNGGIKPPYKRNQFGGSIGGPVIKDRTFFFGSYEGLRERLGNSRLIAVPGIAVRAGTISPITRPYVDSYPLPNVVQPNGSLDLSDRTGRFSDFQTQPTSQNYWTARVDHKFNDSDNFFTRFTYDHALQFRPGSGGFNTGADIATSSRFLTMEEAHIFSPALLARTNFSFTRTNLADTDKLLDGFTMPKSSFTDVKDEPGNISVSGTGGLSGWGGDSSTPQIHIQNTYQLHEDINYTKGQHSMKIGGQMERFQVNQRSDFYPAGGFGFNSLSDFLNDVPSTANFTRPGSDNIRGWRQTLVGLYLQDDIHVQPRLTLNLGLRYEFVTVPTEANNKVASIRNFAPAHLYTVLPNQTDVGDPLWVNPSVRNFAPRVGFAWQPFANGKTSVRAGAGFFHDQIMFSAITTSGVRVLPFYAVAGMNQNSLTPLGITIDFPNAYTTQKDLLIQNIGSKPQIDAFEWNVSQPTIYKYSFDVEHQIVRDTTISAGYTGSRGTHLVRGNILLNSTTASIINGRRFINLTSGALQNPEWDRMRWRITDGTSNYNALRLNFSKRFSQGFQVGTAYTYSKSTDDSSTWTGGSDFGSADRTDYQAAKPHGLSGFDVRHSFYTNYSYDFPGQKLRGAAGKMLGGWQTSGVIRFSSGYPVSLTAATPRNGSISATYVSGSTLDLIPGGNTNPIHPGNPDSYYDYSQFAFPKTCLTTTACPETGGVIGYFQGNLGRNTLTVPGVATFDWTLVKNTAIPSLGEAAKLEFRAEFFNLFNRPNFSAPTLGIFDRNGALQPAVVPPGTTSSTGVVGGTGQINSTAQSARQIQFALRLAF